MKRLVVMAVLGVMALAVSAEEKSFLSGLFGSESKSAVETAATQDSQVVKLLKQLEDLATKIESAKSSSQGEIDLLKQKYEELKTQLKAKLEEFKAKATTGDAESAERKAELAQTKTNAVNLVNGLKSLLKK